MEEERPTEQERQPTPGERARAFVDNLVVLVVLVVDILVGDWRPSERQVLQWIRIAVVVGSVLLVVLLILYGIGRLFGITLLNLLKVLAVPITVGAAVPLLNWLQKKRELDIENQRAQDDALQAYLDQMGVLMLKEGLRTSEEVAEVRVLAQSRTLTMLERLDATRKPGVMNFLMDAALVQARRYYDASDDRLPEDRPPVISLYTANLSGANLIRADLRRADLRGADLHDARLLKANLRGAILFAADLRDADLSSYSDLTEADLRNADLRGADLRGARLLKADLRMADLRGADLRDVGLRTADLDRADLRGADLRGAWLIDTHLTRAKLSEADLSRAIMTGTNLRVADLSDANLSGADLTDATVTDAQLSRCDSLEGATMPNGQKYEEWLKDKAGRGKEGENSSPS
jgi:uncharacterized protein YjbI with pentapeptide repeats